MLGCESFKYLPPSIHHLYCRWRKSLHYTDGIVFQLIVFHYLIEQFCYGSEFVSLLARLIPKLFRHHLHSTDTQSKSDAL
jgi:hypothetical protein